jgi:hypothetical protein
VTRKLSVFLCAFSAPPLQLRTRVCAVRRERIETAEADLLHIITTYRSTGSDIDEVARRTNRKVCVSAGGTAPVLARDHNNGAHH